MMNQHSAALILPYYGRLPNYFPLWLKTAGFNRNFTFMIFSDENFSGYNIPPNVHVNYMTFDEIKNRISKHLDFNFVLDRPYKLCDYRPLYGLIFQDYLEGYDFWGHCDPDIIWGNMGKFITDYLLNRFDKLYRRGHLVLYRNSEKARTFALNKLPGWNVSYRDIFRTGLSMHFDELALIENLFSKYADGGGGYYDRVVFADVSPSVRQFRCSGYDIPLETVAAFKWKDGVLEGLGIDGDPETVKEYLYVHLQKRAMKFEPGIENWKSFMIIPNEFVRDHELTFDEIQNLIMPRKGDLQLMPSSRRNMKSKIKRFINVSIPEKILYLKNVINRILGRRLRSRYTQRCEQ